MVKLLTGRRSVVLEHGHILETRVVLQIMNALRGQQQELRYLRIRGLPQFNVMANALHQHFMCAHGIHGVINAFRAAVRLAFNPVQRRGMHHGHYRPSSGFRGSHGRDDLRRMWCPGTKKTISGLRLPFRLVTNNHPGACDGILAQFHADSSKQSVRKEVKELRACSWCARIAEMSTETWKPSSLRARSLVVALGSK